jgi:hypothetical protein
MNVICPPPCPPHSESWRELVACWDTVEDFKAFMTEVMAEVVDQQLGGLIQSIVAEQLNSHPPTQNIVENIVNNYITQNVVPRVGVVDGSNAAPGEIGEYYTNTTTVNVTGGISQTQSVTAGTLPPGDWLVVASLQLDEGVAGMYMALSPLPAGVSNDMSAEAFVNIAAGGGIVTGGGVVNSHPARASLTANTPFVFSVQTNYAGTPGGDNTTGPLILQAWRIR